MAIIYRFYFSLTQKVANRFEGLLLSHKHSDLAFFAVTHNLDVSDTTLFPLIVCEAIEFSS
jgi:hypothetical protein